MLEKDLVSIKRYIENIICSIDYEKHTFDGYMPFCLARNLYQKSLDKFLKTQNYQLTSEEVIEQVNNSIKTNKEFYLFCINKQNRVKTIQDEMYNLKFKTDEKSNIREIKK